MNARGRIDRLAASLPLSAAVAAGAAAAAPVEPAPPDVMDCAMISRTADEAALVGRFGRAAVKSADLDGAEGQSERGTVVNPADPARRLMIFWSDVAHRRRPASVVIRDRSRWRVRLLDGSTLGLGAGLQEVEGANGRPFAVSGFFWDYGGYAKGWHGGALSRLPGGCNLTVRFDPDPKAPTRTTDLVSGEKDFPSTSPLLRAVKPVVSVISLDWGG